jgi:hypothetical protein
VLSKIALGRIGTPNDVAATVSVSRFIDYRHPKMMMGGQQVKLKHQTNTMTTDQISDLRGLMCFAVCIFL